MGRQAKGVRLIRLDEGQKLHNVVAFEGGDNHDADESGTTIETRSLPVTEDTDDGDESNDEEPESDEEDLDEGDESEDEEPEDDSDEDEF
jgi:hypothetical protein